MMAMSSRDPSSNFLWQYDANEADAARKRFSVLLQQLHDEYATLQEQTRNRTGFVPSSGLAPHRTFSLDGGAHTQARHELGEPLKVIAPPLCSNVTSVPVADLNDSLLQGNIDEAPASQEITNGHEPDKLKFEVKPSLVNSDASEHARCSTKNVSVKKFRDQFQRLDKGEGHLSPEACSDLIKHYAANDSRSTRIPQSLAYLRDDTRSTSDECILTFDMYLSLMRMPLGSMENIDAEEQTSLVLLHHAFVAEEAVAATTPQHHFSQYMDIVPAPVIILNCLVMGLRADIDPDAAFWKVLDVSFLCLYVLEILVKVYLWGFRTYICGRDKFWNIFDVACVFISIADIMIEMVLPLFGTSRETEIGPLMIIKMFRLARLGRLVRALRYPFFAELKTIVYGVLSGMRVLLWAIVLLVISIYFFGVAMNSITKDETTLLEFRTVPASMFTLFRCFTDGCAAYDGTPLQERLFEMYGAWFMIAYVLTYMFVTFGLFNLIMAIFIDNVSSSAMTRRQREVAASEGDIRSKFEVLLARFVLLTHHVHLPPVEHRLLEEQLEKDASKAFDLLPDHLSVPHSVFNAWAQTDDFTELMRDADIDIANQLQLFDVLDADISGELGIYEVIDGLLRLRGSSTKSDLVGMTLKIEYITKLLQEIGKHFGIDPYSL